MEFWLFAICLTIAATLVVLLPLTRGRIAAVSADHNDLEVYRDQMREIDADAGRGMIDPQSAQQARLEIARRLLRAEKLAADSDAQLMSKSSWQRIVALAAVLSVPLISWGVYSVYGSPDLPSLPLSARLTANPERNSVEELIARAERHLAEQPQDGRGWDVLAPIYLRLGRSNDSVNAYRTAIRLQGENYLRVIGLGEALSMAAGGTITSEAQKLFEKAATLEPNDVRPQYFLARGMIQDGHKDEAAAMLQGFLDKAPADAPWRGQLADAIAQIKGNDVTPQKGPSADEIEAAAKLSDTDRTAMIENMVAGLNEKLKADPNDVDGWKRLVRSYVIMKRDNDALDALKRGAAALDAAKRDDLVKYAQELGVVTGDVKP